MKTLLLCLLALGCNVEPPDNPFVCLDMPAEHAAAFESAAAEWNELAGSDVVTGRAPCRPVSDREIYVAREVDMPAGIAGHTDVESMTITVKAQPPETARATALHELGHALGLDHTPGRDDLMYPDDNGQVALSSGDLREYREVHPR